MLVSWVSGPSAWLPEHCPRNIWIRYSGLLGYQFQEGLRQCISVVEVLFSAVAILECVRLEWFRKAVVSVTENSRH